MNCCLRSRRSRNSGKRRPEAWFPVCCGSLFSLRISNWNTVTAFPCCRGGPMVPLLPANWLTGSLMKTNNAKEAWTAGRQRPDCAHRSRTRVSRARASLVPAQPEVRMGDVPHHGKRMPAHPQQARISVSGPDSGASSGHTGRTGRGGRPSFLARLRQHSGSGPVRLCGGGPDDLEVLPGKPEKRTP